MPITAPPGVFDILPNAEPEKWRSSHLWHYVESIARSTAQLFGFEEIRTPLFEKEELFVRSVGKATDVVSKEMYTFVDRGDRKLALRPEGTAAVMRAFIEHHLDQKNAQHKFFYISPMFRYERAQAGRYRQHHQFGVEIIGTASPAQDVEMIDLLWTFCQKLGLRDLTLHLNCLGSSSNRSSFRTALLQYLSGYREKLSADSQKRLEVNPLRILDSKDPSDQEVLINAPKLCDFLSPEVQEQFAIVGSLLEEINIPYQINHRLVRGLDYYNGTVFEMTSSALGAQNSIGGGGRYDGLLKQLGGPDLPTFGFGSGLERIIQTLLAQEIPPPQPAGPLLFLIPLGETAQKSCFALMHRLRHDGLPIQMELGERKLNKAMHYANAIRAHYTAVIGDNELAQQSIRLKEMSTGTLHPVTFAALKDYLKEVSSQQ